MRRGCPRSRRLVELPRIQRTRAAPTCRTGVATLAPTNSVPTVPTPQGRFTGDTGRGVVAEQGPYVAFSVATVGAATWQQVG